MSSLSDCMDPFLNVISIWGLKVKCSGGGYESKGIGVVLEGHRCAGVDVGKVQQAQKFVFRIGFIERKMGGTQNEPTLLPSLNVIP